MSNIQRVTISVPAALRERMEAVKGQVNWSAVAARAFESKLLELEIAAKKGHMSKQDIVNRLKTAQENDTEDYEDGKAAGRAWAAKTATAKELKRLADYIEACDREQGGPSWWDADSNLWNAPFGAAANLVFAMRPRLRDDRDAPGAFWEAVLGDDQGRIDDADFLHGFGDGALEVWEEVSNEL